jgi:hypothetical protein
MMQVWNTIFWFICLAFVVMAFSSLANPVYHEQKSDQGLMLVILLCGFAYALLRLSVVHRVLFPASYYKSWRRRPMNEKRTTFPFVEGMRETLMTIIIMTPFLGIGLGIGAGLLVMIVTVALRWAGWVVRGQQTRSSYQWQSSSG